MRRIIAVFRRHLVEALRNPDRIDDILLWPFLDVVTWGLLSRYLMHGRLHFAAPEQLVAGIALWGAFRAFQRDVAVGFLAEIWSRNLAPLFVSPLSPGEFLAGLFALNLLKLGLGLGLIALALRVLTGLPGAALLLRLLPPLAVLLCFGAAIGLLVTALILRFSTRVQTLAYGLAGILMPLSCVFYPLASLPKGLRGIARLLPTTQAFEAMRSVMVSGHSALSPLLWGGAVALLTLTGALWLFDRALRAARRTGRLLRLD